MTSASDEKWRPFNCFFQSGRAEDLSAPLYSPTLVTRKVLDHASHLRLGTNLQITKQHTV